MDLEEDSKTGLIRFVDRNYEFNDVFNFSQRSVPSMVPQYSVQAEMSIEEKEEEKEEEKKEPEKPKRKKQLKKSRQSRLKEARQSEMKNNKKDRLSNLKQLSSIAKLIYETTDDYSYRCLCQNMKEIQSVFLNRIIQGKQEKSLKRRLYDICNVSKSITDCFPGPIAQHQTHHMQFENMKDCAHDILYQTASSCLDMTMQCMVGLVQFQEMCVGTNSEENQLKLAMELLVSLSNDVEQDQRNRTGQTIIKAKRSD